MSEPKHLLTSIQLLAVDLHDTGQHADYFILHEQKKLLLTDEARRAKYISRILNLLEHFNFYILHFLYVRQIW